MKSLENFLIKGLLLGPPLLFLTFFFVIPLGLLVVYSFYINPPGAGMYQPGFTLENYLRLIEQPFYLNRVLVTLKFGVLVTLITVFIGYPLAYYLARTNSTGRRLGFLALLSVLFITYIIRAFSWSVILSDNGVINTILSFLGGLKISIYPGTWAVVMGLVYSFYPFFVITLFTSLRNINVELEEASQILGANRIKTFLKVTLPLSKSGLLAGALWVFVLTVGSYVNPVILGKPRDWFLPVIIERQVFAELNVPFASVLSLILVFTVGIVMFFFARFVGLQRVWRQ